MEKCFTSIFLYFIFLTNSYPQDTLTTTVNNSPAFGNDSTKSGNSHFFTLYSGYSSQVMKDDVFSPFIYSGYHAPIVIDYDYMRANSRHTFSVSYIKTKLKSGIPDLANGLTHYTGSYFASLSYSYSRIVFSVPRYKVQCFIGGRYKSFVNLRNHHYSENRVESNFEQISTVGLNFTIEKRFLRNNNLLRFNIHTPLLGYSIYNDLYSEKSYMGKTFDINNPNVELWKILKSGKVISLNKYFELQSDISYTKLVSKKVGFSLSCGFDYYSFAQYKQLFRSRNLITQLLLGLTVKI
jgi:hypothetical protein